MWRLFQFLNPSTNHLIASKFSKYAKISNWKKTAGTTTTIIPPAHQIPWPMLSLSHFHIWGQHLWGFLGIMLTQRVYYYLGPPLCVVSRFYSPRLCKQGFVAEYKYKYILRQLIITHMYLKHSRWSISTTIHTIHWDLIAIHSD